MNTNAMSINVSRTDQYFNEEEARQLLSSIKVLEEKALIAFGIDTGLRFSDGQELWIHHTFNVQHPETYVWEVDLTAAILSHGLTFKATAFDPGADELTFHWDFGDGTNVTTFYPNVNETYPVEIMEIINHVFPGSGTYTVVLTVEDDDGGVGVAMITVTIP